MMTVVGVTGSMIIALGLYLANRLDDDIYVTVSVLGFVVQWYGDSMDGRLAYYRNKARRWYGWALDLMADWASTCFTSLGIYFYFPEYPFLALLFCGVYLGTMIVTLVKFNLTQDYTIDSGLVGPTELRIITCLMFLIELGVDGTLFVFAFLAPGILLIINFSELYKVLKLGNEKDREVSLRKEPEVVPEHVEEPV